MRTIIAKLQEQHALGKAVVLATLIYTEGSTYRRPGARMLITEEGQFFGLVSGGCLEADLVLHAKKVFFNRRSRIAEYDMRAEEEGAWGLALGCNGVVRIHLQYMPAEHSSLLIAACAQADDRHQPVTLITDISEGQENDAPTALYDHDGLVSSVIPQDSLTAVRQTELTEASFSTANFIDHQGRQLFAEKIEPQFHLLILGAGPDAGPVCSIATLMGWYVSLVDHRVAYTNKARTLGAHQVVVSEPHDLARQVDLDSVDAVLLMSHSLNADKDYFACLQASSVAYIGMLGPKERSEMILAAHQPMSQDCLERIHAPVGLDVGGEGPEAIAVSIVAEIQASFSQRSGLPLRDKEGGIHDR